MSETKIGMNCDLETRNKTLIDYDSLLNEWYDKVVKEAEKAETTMSNEEYVEINGTLKAVPTLKYQYAKGFRDGLYYATAILSRLENKNNKDK